ncbi:MULTISPECIES: site-specific integrase [Methylobacterium]|uniref:site-specific integrase n=1 Tax=Methylobacterium TaxID=407 RepID=UPI0013EAF40B|nr:site-specific integrase [Methylobacterium sp. DB0501]NGM38133.1 tyrosine-type recombinase/integrase [Methylobacterium sp. DB0501]
MSNAEIADLRLNALAAARGPAASSLKTYRRDLASCPGGRGLAAVTRDDMVAYRADLDRDALPHSTISRRRSVAQGLHRFPVAEGSGSGNPTTELQLRPAFAIRLLQNGADLRVIGELLGCADRGTTEVYTEADVSPAQRMVRPPLSGNRSESSPGAA